MSALDWVWYMMPNIQESKDGNWRIYKGRKYGSKTPTYSLLRVLPDGAMRCVYHADTADKCKKKAAKLAGDSNVADEDAV